MRPASSESTRRTASCRARRSERSYKGGLADHAVETTRLHTASHLLQAGAAPGVGPGVRQMGSNITAERLRFDFSHPERLSEEQLAEVERIVNQQIARDLPVINGGDAAWSRRCKPARWPSSARSTASR